MIFLMSLDDQLIADLILFKYGRRIICVIGFAKMKALELILAIGRQSFRDINCLGVDGCNT